MTEQEAIEIVKDLDARGYPTYREAKRIAIYSIEKQIAKKPIVTVDEHTKLCWIRCSCCDATIYWRFPKPFQYCVECGQKLLDWGNEDAE